MARFHFTGTRAGITGREAKEIFFPDDKYKRAPTLAEQDSEFVEMARLGLSEGPLGSWTDDHALQLMNDIENSNVSDDAKYQALDRLAFGVQNHCDRGMLSPVHETVCRAMDKYCQ